MPDAHIVPIPCMQGAETLLPLHTLPRGQLAAVLHHDHQHVVHRGRHVLRLVALVAELAHGLHRRALQQGAVGQRRVVDAEEGVAEGAVDAVERRQQGAVVRHGAVVGLILVAGRGHGHIVGRRQALAAGALLVVVHGLGLAVGRLVRPVVDEPLHALPVGLGA